MAGETDAKPKTKIYQIHDDGSIAFRSERKSGEVRIPNYVYDLWLPLLGIEAIGVYTLYCRLEYEGGVTRITQDRLAKMCRTSKSTLRRHNDTLQSCGFIEIKSPTGKDRLKHYTTEIVVKDPPKEVDAILIRQYQIKSGYEPLTNWLCEAENYKMYGVSPSDVQDSTSGGTGEYARTDLDSTSKVASLIVASLEVEEKKEIPAPIVADAAETIEPTIVEANTPALPTTEGKILAFTPATETDEDTPPRRQRKPSKNAPMHDALIASFNLSGIKMNPKADKMYWAVAAELSDFPVDRVSELYSYVRRKSQVEKWNTFTVNALAKYAPDFLRDHPHKVTYIVDDSALPKAAGAEGDAIPITADKRAEAERLMAELLAKMNGNGVKRDGNRQ